MVSLSRPASNNGTYAEMLCTLYRGNSGRAAVVTMKTVAILLSQDASKEV